MTLVTPKFDRAFASAAPRLARELRHAAGETVRVAIVVWTEAEVRISGTGGSETLDAVTEAVALARASETP